MIFDKFKIETLVVSLLFVVAIFAPIYNSLAATDSVFGGLDSTADQVNEIRNGMGKAASAGNDTATTFLSKKIGGLVGAVLAFIGVIFLLLIVYGGFMWMTAAGNDQQVEKARNVIVASVIGLVIVLSAYAITSFVGQKLTS